MNNFITRIQWTKRWITKDDIDELKRSITGIDKAINDALQEEKINKVNRLREIKMDLKWIIKNSDYVKRIESEVFKFYNYETKF